MCRDVMNRKKNAVMMKNMMEIVHSTTGGHNILMRRAW